MPSINYIQKKKKLADKSWGTDICQGIKVWLMTDVLLLELETKENLPKDANIADINLTELSNSNWTPLLGSFQKRTDLAMSVVLLLVLVC